MSLQIITDSASDLAGCPQRGLRVLPMTITFGQTTFRDGVDLSQRQFYEKLIEEEELPVTSQIPPYDFEQAIRAARRGGSEVLIITMSGKLSGTFQSATIAADGDAGVRVVDSENVTIGERILVEYALTLAEQGMGLTEIWEELESAKHRIRLVALLDTLEYLKKGGRISPAAAFAGTLLSIRPVVAVEHGEVVVLGKARGSQQANNLIAQQLSRAGIDAAKPYCLGYTGGSDGLVRKYVADNAALWADLPRELPICPVGGTIGTHAGPGAIAVAWFAK